MEQTFTVEAEETFVARILTDGRSVELVVVSITPPMRRPPDQQQTAVGERAIVARALEAAVALVAEFTGMSPRNLRAKRDGWSTVTVRPKRGKSFSDPTD